MHIDATTLGKFFLNTLEWVLRYMLLKNEIPLDECKAMQQQSKMFQNDRIRFTVKFGVKLCVS